MADPTQQFNITPLIRLGEFAGHEIARVHSSAVTSLAGRSLTIIGH